MAYTTLTDVATGDVLTATAYNNLIGNAATLALAWTAFTPQLRTGTTNVASTNNYGRYLVMGKLVIAQAKVTATAVGTASGVLKLSTPTGVATQVVEAAIGSYLVKDTGTAYYTGVALFEETGYVSGQAYGGGGTMGANTPAMTIAVGDVVSYAVVYEIS